MERGLIERWTQDYRMAWERADADEAASLFRPDARYWSSPFRKAHEGEDGIHAYWSEATETQSDTSVRMGEPLVDRDQIAVEWWASWNERGEGPITLPGVLLLRFDKDGLCSSLRENWMSNLGRHEPVDGWGDYASGDTEVTRSHVQTWTIRYEDAWRRKDPEAAAALYAENTTYRTSPFRDAAHGRAAVLEYTKGAYSAEEDQVPIFGEPIVEGGTAAVEWWCPMKDEGIVMTLSGCSILTFTTDGLVLTARDVWNVEHGRHAPHSDWG